MKRQPERVTIDGAGGWVVPGATAAELAEVRAHVNELAAATEKLQQASAALRAAGNMRLASACWLAFSAAGWALLAAYYHDRLKGCVCP